MYDAFIAEEYEKDGEKKARFHRVGVAFDAKNAAGMDLVITPGISVSGRISVRERRGKDSSAAEAADGYEITF